MNYGTAEYTLPSHWACYLIHGDASGMEDQDQADCDAFLAAHPELGSCLDVEDLGFSGCNDWTHLGDDVSLFTFLVEDKQLERPTMCNGWSNRETWIVNLWFNPESKADLEYVREHLEEELDKIESGVLKDMINLGAINWRELEEDCCEYEEEDEEQPS